MLMVDWVEHKRDSGFVPRSDAKWKWESTAFFVVGGRFVCDKYFYSRGKGDVVCNVGPCIAHRLRLCASRLMSAVTGAGTCEEVFLQTGGRVDHLPVFADVSIQPLQGIKNVQRKKCICDVRMARFDSDAIQRFEAAIALASCYAFDL